MFNFINDWNQAFFLSSLLGECFRPILLHRRNIIESTMSSFSRLRRSDFRSFSELKILSTLHCVGGKANIRSATSLRSWGYNSLTTRCRSVGLRFNCFMMVSEFSFKICKPCFTIVLNISILADISNLTFLSKNSVFTWKYYIMSWNTRSTPETLSGAFKLSAPVSFSGEKKSTFSSPESTPEYSGVGVLHNPAGKAKLRRQRRSSTLSPHPVPCCSLF